jgi:outer membrane protein assembly factor BamB
MMKFAIQVLLCLVQDRPGEAHLYVALQGGGVAALDAGSGKLLWSTDLGEKVFGVIAVGGRAYATLPDRGRLVELDASTGKTLRSADVGKGAHQPASDGSRIFVPLSAEGKVAVVDLKTLSVAASVEVGGVPHIASLAKNTLYVSVQADQSIAILDVGAEPRLVGRVALNGRPRVVRAIDDARAAATVHWIPGALMVDRKQILRRWEAEPGPFDPDGKEGEGVAVSGDIVAVTNETQKALLIFEGDRPVRKVGFETRPYWVELSNGVAYVSLPASGSVAAVDAATGRTLWTASVGRDPRRMFLE